MGTTTITTFGPGSLEGIRLERRRRQFATIPPRPYTVVRAVGTFRVYCGEGWEHLVNIRTPWVDLAYLAHDLDTTPLDLADDRMAHELLDAALSDWADPCSTEG